MNNLDENESLKTEIKLYKNQAETIKDITIDQIDQLEVKKVSFDNIRLKYVLTNLLLID